MQVSVTFRHMDSSQPLRDYAVSKLERLEKYFRDPMRAQVVLSTERHRHQVDVNITLQNGIVLKGREVTDDMYAAIDLVLDKIERQVRRYKTRIRDHRTTEGPQVPVAHEVFTSNAERVDSSAEEREMVEREVVYSSRFFAKPMTLEEAIMQMDLREARFLVFTNADTQDVNVVYKRRDGHVGLIETGRSAEQRR